jgi:outer membrane murein-binding lipoprotein Lpp
MSKTMKTSRNRILGAVVAATLLFGACSDDDNDTDLETDLDDLGTQVEEGVDDLSENLDDGVDDLDDGVDTLQS